MADDAIRHFLNISTGHIPKADNDRLQALDRESHDFPVRVIHHEIGWFINCPSDSARETDAELRQRGMSDAFLGIMRLARQHDCWWINLHGDGEDVEGLPTFEW